MTTPNQASNDSAQTASPVDVESLQQANAQLCAKLESQETKIQQLKQQLDWFKRQLFGEKSEKRLMVDPAIQPSLLEGLVAETEAVTLPKKNVASHERQQKSLWTNYLS